MPSKKNRNHPLWIAILFLVLALLTPSVVIGLPSSSLTTILILMCLSLPVGGILFALSRSKKIDWFEPIYGWMIVFILGYSLRAVYAYILRPSQTVLPFRFYFESPGDALNVALFYASIGIMALLIGYFSNFPQKIVQRLPIPNAKKKTRHFMAIMYVLFSVGLFFTFLQYREGSFSVFMRGEDTSSSFAYIIDLMAKLVFYVPILTLAALFERNRQEQKLYWLSYVGMSLIGVVVAVLSGGKLPLVILFIGSAIVFYYKSKSTRKRWFIAAAALLVISVFPLVSVFRTYYIQTLGYTTQIDLDSATQLVINSGDFVDISNNQTASLVDVIMNRTVPLDSLIVAVKYTPEVMDFQYGRDLVLAPFLAFIPRFIWADKPIVGLSPENFTILYMGSTRITYDANWSGGSAITAMGDLYINFHVVGIVIGMFIFGIIGKILWLYMKRMPIPVVMLMYSVGYVSLLNLDTSVSGLLSGWTKLIVFFGLVHRAIWLFEDRKSQPASDETTNPII